jgi:hypothetical protein
MDGREDVGWNEKGVWRMPCHFPRETHVRPQARERHDPQFGVTEETARWGLAKIQAEAMGAFVRQDRLDETS